MRKLTKVEEERKIKYEGIRDSLVEEGYEEHPLLIGVVFANVMAIGIGIVFGALFVWMFLLINPGEKEHLELDFIDSIYILVLYFVSVVIHELIHGLCFGAFCKSHYKAIQFGVVWQYLMPYCTCSEPLSKGAYCFGAVMPTIILGFIPSIIGVYACSYVGLAIGILMIMGGGADIIVVCKLLRHKGGKDSIFIDHPYECGLVAFDKNFPNSVTK